MHEIVALGFRNAGQIVYFAWFEVVAICLFRVTRTDGPVQPANVELDHTDATKVLIAMILLGVGFMIGRAPLLLFGPANWPLTGFVLGTIGTGLRATAIYVYIRTITADRGETFWSLLLAGSGGFALFFPG